MKRIHTACLQICVFATFLLLAPALRGQDKMTQQRQKHFCLQDKVALSGYDPVSYFEMDAPVKGKPQFAHTYQGITYHFVNVRHLESFKKNPSRYEPAYGGWCAFALGKTGKKLAANVECFKIINNRLFVFYQAKGMNALELWNQDEANMQKRADVFWEKILASPTR
ncbi:MAG: YHS domain protein [Microscillaceae bacterium]|nr:YHS domain protein [Microscillaceae bacterium]